MSDTASQGGVQDQYQRSRSIDASDSADGDGYMYPYRTLSTEICQMSIPDTAYADKLSQVSTEYVCGDTRCEYRTPRLGGDGSHRGAPQCCVCAHRSHHT